MRARDSWNRGASLALCVLLLLCCGASLAQACAPIPATSVCARFFPAGHQVDVAPRFSCMEDAEASLKSAPVLWSALSTVEAASGGSGQCAGDVAQMLCLLTFRPCQQLVSRQLCHRAVGDGLGNPGSCPQQLQDTFLSLLVPNFRQTFNCSTNPLLSDVGAGPLVDTMPPLPKDQCQPLRSDSICRGVVDYDVYVPWNLNGDQTLIERNVVDQFRSAMMTAQLATGCLKSLSKALCSLVYTRCDTGVLQASLGPYVPPGPVADALPLLQIPFPKLPCRDLCTTARAQCPILMASQPALASMLNCTGVGTVLKPTPTCGGAHKGDAGENFPEQQSILARLELAGTPVPIVSQCNAFVNVFPTNESSVFTCPSQLAVASGPNDPNAILGGSCATPCPSFLFTRDEWRSGERFYTGIGVTSFVMSLLLWLTWVVFPSKRKQRNTICFNTCTLMLSFAVLVVLIKTDGHPSHINCTNDSNYVQQKDGGACVFQAIFFFYFCLAGVMFWFYSAVDLYMKIVLNWKIDLLKQRKLNLFYQISGWGVPLLFLSIGLGLEAFGGGTGTMWCFFRPGNASEVDWSLFYYPILLFVAGGSFCMGSIIYKMVLSARVTGSTRRAGWWKTQIRPALFIFIFVFLFAFIFSYRVHIFFKTERYEETALEWVQCLIARNGDPKCGAKPSDTPNIGLFYMIMLAISGQGIFNSIIFGSSKVNFLLWYGLLTGKGTNFTGQSGVSENSKSETQSRPRRGISGRNNLELGGSKDRDSHGGGAVAPRFPAGHVHVTSPSESARTIASGGGSSTGASSGFSRPMGTSRLASPHSTTERDPEAGPGVVGVVSPAGVQARMPQAHDFDAGPDAGAPYALNQPEVEAAAQDSEPIVDRSQVHSETSRL